MDSNMGTGVGVVGDVREQQVARDKGLGAGPHLLCARAQYEIVSSHTLVGCDEFGDVDGGPRAQSLQMWPQLLLQPPVQHLCTPHRLSQVQRRYVPAWGGGGGHPQAQPGPEDGPLQAPPPTPAPCLGPRPPSNTRSSGATMGSSALKGTNTSWPSASKPRLTVPACVSEP